jgi:hypothetical protein
VAPLVLFSLETTGLMSGCTTMVSSSTEVASVPVAPSREEDEGLACLDWAEELAGEGCALTEANVAGVSSTFKMVVLVLGFFVTSSGEGVGTLDSRFRFWGDCRGSTEGDFPGDSAFLNLDSDLGVLLGT